MSRPKREQTPMLKQFMSIKKQHPDAVMFYRMGDFFEMFYDDAKTASQVLGLRLTSRAHGKSADVPLAGFPHHQLDSYLTRMVKAGYRVVIVEQVEDPKKAKGLVKRDVVRIATAGTNPADVDHEEPKPNRIAALIRENRKWGFAWSDIATGEFSTGEFNDSELRMIASQVAPVELVVPDNQGTVGPPPLGDVSPPLLSKVESWFCEPVFARQTLTDHFGTKGLKGFGIDHLPLAISAAGALLHYLKGNLRTEVSHFTSLSRAEISGTLVMEATTRRNLELVASLSGNDRATLFAVIDRSVTAAGRRLLFNRLLTPLAERERIEDRLGAVEELVNDSRLCRELRELLKRSGDIQRYLARLATGRGSARDLVALRETLGLVPDYQQHLRGVHSSLLQALHGRLDALDETREALQVSLTEEPPLSTTEGGMIRPGYNHELDELRQIRHRGRSWLDEYEGKERVRTGIPKLKIKYNRVFGYFIEVTKTQTDKIPEEYIRRQTLVGAERYTTVELQEYESKLLGAEEKITALEREIFTSLVAKTLEYSSQLQENAKVLAEIDFAAGLATLARDEEYARPVLNDGDSIILKESRHPVVEKLLPPGEQFITNDLEFGGTGKRIIIVTGPNMAGKSTYLRQVAIIVLMAQMGSFVPAKEAKIGIVDKLFTRIGALDNLAGGESTFLVEMQETASILNNATRRSLVLFDEVGRGTSTFDGLSLAWSIVEYLHETDKLCPRTLFATHFHEMVDLENHLKQVVNQNVAVREFDDKVVFLRKIIPGGCDRSFGIHVAQMAGLPGQVIARAREVLSNLEANDLNPNISSAEFVGNKARSNEVSPVNGELMPSAENVLDNKKQRVKTKYIFPRPHRAQLSLFDPLERELRDLLEGVDPDNLTPMEAHKLIAKLKQML